MSCSVWPTEMNSVFGSSSLLLTWRDVQHLLVKTSRPVHLKADDWKTNAAGLRGTLRSASNTHIIHLLFYSESTFNKTEALDN